MSIISNLTPDVKNTVKWVAIGLLGIACSIGVWKVSSFIKDLRESEAKIAKAETNEKIAIANRDGLKDAIDEINKNLEEIHEKNRQLEEKVKESGKKIDQISRETKETLDALDKEEIPDDAEAQVEWLRSKAIKKGKEFSDKHD